MSGPSTYETALFHGPGSEFRLGRFTLPRLQAGEVLVRVSCCTLCGSDFHTYSGRRKTTCPSILGHEIVGVVEDVSQVEPVLDQYGHAVYPGDRITWSIVVSCGKCRTCRRNLPQKCESQFKYGHEQFLPGGSPSGGLSQFCVLRRDTAIFPVPASVPDATAAIASCAGATVSAALQTAGSVKGACVLVQGAGTLGLVAAAMVREAGAARIVVIDPNAGRLQRAATFGASDLIDGLSSAQAIQERIAQVTGGGAIDIALEFSGDPAAVETALPLLAVGGVYVLSGSVFPSPSASLNVETVVRMMVRIVGVHNYPPDALRTAISFLSGPAARTYPFESLIGASFNLEELDKAFAYGKEAHPARIAIVPNH